MAIVLEIPKSADELAEFVRFEDRASSGRTARWRTQVERRLAVLSGESPQGRGRELCPIVAREDGEVVARVVALLDQRYVRHWNERIGHVVWFEACPGKSEAVRMLMDQACIWLAERDVQAVRTGFSFALHDMPFTIDSYDALPPSTLRQNPACYHGLLKQAGFEVERGFSDYRVRVAPERVERWQVALDLARQGGLEILPLSDIPSPRRVRDFTSTWNDSFEEHWGFAPSLEEEWAQVFEEPAAASVLATSAIAYRDREPVGLLFTAAEDAGRAVLASGRPLDPNERLDPVAIGVREHERGGGVATALAAAVFLARVRRGQQWLGCILALDGNRAGRRLAERLGAEIGTSHLSYRRDLGWTSAGVAEPRSSWNG